MAEPVTAVDAAAVDPLVINEPPSSQSGRNGLDQYDFSDDFGEKSASTLVPMVDGTMDNFSSVNSSPAPAEMANKVPKLKIKMQVPC